MATPEQVGKVLMRLAEIQACPQCETRLRWGDFECPHCGQDVEDTLRQWAERLIHDIDDRSAP